jgi:hypothetical protein
MKHLLATVALSLIVTPAFAQDRMTVMLDWFINPDHGPIIPQIWRTQQFKVCWRRQKLCFRE